MRFARTTALVGTALAYWALGPWVLLAVAGALALPQVRWWLRPTARVAAAWVGVILAVTGVVVLLPDGWLPIPPGGGSFVTPSYRGSPVGAQPIDLGVDSGSALHPGPLGDGPEVTSSWFGLEDCASIRFESHGRLVARCTAPRATRLVVIDPDSLNPVASLALHDGDDRCGTSFYVDAADRAVVPTADGRIITVRTSDGDGEPALLTESAIDLGETLPADDCLLGVLADRDGRGTWWVTRDGRAGLATQRRVAGIDLGEEITQPPAVGPDGDIYVVTTERLVRLRATGRRVQVEWEASYDGGSGTPPTVLPDGLVAITDDAEPQMNVVFVRQSDGERVCAAPVFEAGQSGDGATGAPLVVVDRNAVVVQNTHGYAGLRSTLLGLSTSRGLARVEADVATATCTVAWTTEVAGPTAAPTVSWATGLVYAATKRSNWWGVNAWYLTAVDARTGRHAFSVRTGIGAAFTPHRSAVTLGTDGAAYVATVAGMVRVRDGE